MGKIIVNEFLTLDGVLQAPGQPDEDPSGGFPHGGWQAPYVGPDSGEAIGAELAGMSVLLLGRRTYELFAGYWPRAPADDPIARIMNGATKVVASRTLDRVDWENSRLLGPDLRAGVEDLKRGDADVHVIGSANLVQSLLQEGLVDELHLLVYPLVLGSGKRLFAEGTVPTALRLTSSRTFENGVVQLNYELGGEPTYGNMGYGEA